MRIRDITDFMEGLAPGSLAESWDNVGMLVGSVENEVRRVLLALDVTPEVVEEAVGMKAELIMTHHPVIFRGLNSILENEPKGNLISRLVRNRIGVFSAHTNLDVAEGGVNDALAGKLGLRDVINFKDYGPFDGKGFRHGLGKVGFLEERIGLREFAGRVKAALEADHVRVIGKAEAGVEKVAVFCGSFDDELEPLQRHEIDVLVTGDVKYHTAQDVLQMGKCVVDAGHFNTEKVILPVLAELLGKSFPDLAVCCSKLEKDPFNIY